VIFDAKEGREAQAAQQVAIYVKRAMYSMDTLAEPLQIRCQQEWGDESVERVWWADGVRKGPL
jgi:hypothetical protein